MQCPVCRTDIDNPSAKFCNECGQAIPQHKICSGCGKELKFNDKFCDGCGTPVSPSSATPAAAPGILGYCAGTGKVITASTSHFKCLECEKLYLASQRYEDKPICQACAYTSGMAQVVEKNRAEQAKLEAQRQAAEAKADAEREAAAAKAQAKLEAEARAEAERTARAQAQRQAREEAERLRKAQSKLGITEADWVEIPAGEFMMGSPETEERRGKNERQHTVAVPGFKMLKTPVTFAMYDVFCKQTGRNKPDANGWGRGNRPVMNVNYWDAVDYCAWLSQETGGTVRLPTEAEWEYACRAGTTTPFWTGKTISTEQANYDGKGSYRKKTTPVDLFRPNPWGLYDMHGNVCEWCASEYDAGYGGMEQRDASGDRSNDSNRVLRGGSWDGNPGNLRSANRHWSYTVFRLNSDGFRLVQDLSLFS